MAEEKSVTQEIIADVKDFYDKILMRSRKLDKMNDWISSRLLKADADEKANKKFKSELDVRGKNISEIEDLNNVREANTETTKNLSIKIKALNKEQNTFEEEKKNHNEENEAERANLTTLRIKITKSQLDLVEAKNKYKQTVMKEINDEIKKQKDKL